LTAFISFVSQADGI